VSAARSAFRDWVEYVAFRAALWSLEFGSREQAFQTARFYVALLDRAVPKLRRTANDNLLFAMPDQNANAVINGVFDSIARMLVWKAHSPAGAAFFSPPPTSETGNSAPSRSRC
jgi:hypothetical protein